MKVIGTKSPALKVPFIGTPPWLARSTRPLGAIGTGCWFSWPTNRLLPATDAMLTTLDGSLFTNVPTNVPELSALLTMAALSTLTVPSRSFAPAVMLLIRSVG